MDGATQSTEPDPADAAVVAELRELMEADPDERTFCHEIGTASPQFLRWYVDQPAKAKRKHREFWNKTTGTDPTFKGWFLGLSVGVDRIAFFDHGGTDRRAFPRV